MSSTTGLNRTRSIRKSAAKDTELAQNKPAHARNASRNISPSRLPMKPPTTTTTTTTATTSRTRAQSGLTSRQVSGGTAARVSSRPVEHGATGTTKPLGRAPSVRQAPSTSTTKPPSSATATATATGRSTNTARPKSSGGITSTTAPRDRNLGHSRAKSTVTSLTAATTLRPLSHDPSRTNPSPAPSSASSASTTTQNVSTPTTRVQTRSQTKHARLPSQSQSQSQLQSQSASALASNPALAARRPAFNTNQQHYSPAKSLAPKPLTATFLAPPSPSKQPANVALTAETSRLQTELLQLSLLHREAHEVTASWHASARSKLGARFAELAAADRALREAERQGAEARGLQDLVRWGNAGPDERDIPGAARGGRARAKSARGGGGGGGDVRERLSLEEKIQLLDQVLNGAWALGEPGGRYHRVLRAFEDWAVLVAEIRAAQQGGDIDGLLARGDGEEGEVGVFVGDLDADAWKRDHAGLVRVLEGWQRTLAQLGTVDADGGEEEEEEKENERAIGKGRNKPPAASNAKAEEVGPETSNPGPPSSGLARTLRGCRSLVDGMLAELRVMEQIELDALAAEEAWMELMEEKLRAEEDEAVDEAESKRRKKKTTRRTGDVLPWKLLL
ncbi:hypothetical protein F5Y14DRAFT_212360 [Nemania sp. NC0429]|nr:hypothetical protein F5Y14DRAFT_212360 [Nemania sp. NC0429]